MIERTQDWDIRARGESCGDCGRPFADRETLYSRLTFGSDGYQRDDYCEPCWSRQKEEPALSVWQSVFRVPPPPPEEPLKKETVESLLRKLMEEGAPGALNTIYILAVMLERRRLLTEKDVQTRDDGMKVRVYEHRKTGETFLIPDPELKLSELEQVQEEVVIMLGGEPRNKAAENEEVSENEDKEEYEDEEEDEDV